MLGWGMAFLHLYGALEARDHATERLLFIYWLNGLKEAPFIDRLPSRHLRSFLEKHTAHPIFSTIDLLKTVTSAYSS